MRLDYNATQNFRINFAFEETKGDAPGIRLRHITQVRIFRIRRASFAQKNYTSSLGLGWTISPSLVNEFRVGYLYTWLSYGAGAQPLWDTEPAVNWGLGNSGQEFNLATGQYYPTISGSDTLTWLHGAHTVSFGFDYAREQDHYYNRAGWYSEHRSWSGKR